VQQRAFLSGLFSRLRLFPGLYDVAAWNARRKRVEVEIALDEQAPCALLKLAARLSGESADPLSPVPEIGSEMTKYLVIAPGDMGKLSAPTARACITGSIEQLMVPIEWAVLEGMSEPLARARPVHRRVQGLGTPPRSVFETHFHEGRTGPPRVLLFGHAAAGLLHVDTELDELQALLLARYRKLGWPQELIHRVPASQANRETLQARLDGSDYDIVHLAGHAGFAGGAPAIQVAGAGGEGDVAQNVSGEALGRWLRGSSVRFVGLSCCEGAATAAGPERAAGWRQSLCKELLEAGVAEVLAHVWPIGDTSAVAFAQRFYGAFVPRFDAPGALHEARREAVRSDPLWASSVLARHA